jgi:hypothetical protein
MATLKDIQTLADELTQVAPPPIRPIGVNFVGTNGRWKAETVGSGLYALRAEYDLANGETVTIKMNDEIVGFPSTIVPAIKFSIMVANSSKFFWSIR